MYLPFAFAFLFALAFLFVFVFVFQLYRVVQPGCSLQVMQSNLPIRVSLIRVIALYGYGFSGYNCLRRHKFTLCIRVHAL